MRVWQARQVYFWIISFDTELFLVKKIQQLQSTNEIIEAQQNNCKRFQIGKNYSARGVRL